MQLKIIYFIINNKINNYTKTLIQINSFNFLTFDRPIIHYFYDVSGRIETRLSKWDFCE